MTGLPGVVVDAELGGSVIYEEYRGDLAAARAAAERAVAAPGDQGSSDAKVALAVVHLLQGAPRPARVLLDQVEAAAGSDPAVALRVVSYRSLAAYLGWNCFPNLSGAGGAEWDIRFADVIAAIADLPARRRALAASAGGAARLEALLVIDLLCMLLPVRRVLDNPDVLPSGQRESARTLALGVPLGFYQEASAAGAPAALLAHALRVAADLSHRMRQDDEAARFLRDALALSEQTGDDPGAACGHLLYGDWQCTAVSSPLVLDHYLQEGAHSDALAWAQESLEFGLDPRHVVTAERMDAAALAYDRAAELFGRAGAPRGKAAVELRRGFLAERSGDREKALELAQAAAEGFDRAGDVLGAWVARVHAAVRQVGLGRLPEDRQTAEALGAWGAGDGSFSFCLGLGLLFAREGRRWLIRDGDYERSLACFRLAEATFDALGARQNLALALADQGETYTAIGEAAFALPAFDKAFAVLADVAAGTGDRTERPWTRAVTLGGSVYSLAIQVMDPDLMAGTAERLDGLFTTPPSAAGETGLGPVVAAGVRSLIEQNPVMVPMYRGLRARRAGHAAEAGAFFDEALRQAEAMSDPARREYLRAVVLATRRRYGEAAQAYRRHMRVRASDSQGVEAKLFAFMHEQLGDAARLEGERRLRQSRIHEEDAAFFTRVRAYQEAEAEFSVVREERGDAWWMDEPRPWELVAYTGEIAEGLGRAEEAVARYDEAIGLLEARRSLLSRDELKTALSGGSAQSLYFNAARACLTWAAAAEAAGDAQGAGMWAGRGFSYAERGKARALLDLMSAAAPAAAASALHGGAESREHVAALGARWRSVSARLAAYRGLQRSASADLGASEEQLAYLASQIASAEAELRDAEAELAGAAPGFRSAINPQAEVIGAADVPAALVPGSLLLEYFFLGDDFLAWAFTPDGPARFVRTSIDASALSARIRALRDACQDGRPVDAAAADLAGTFLRPFASLIDRARHVLLIPYGTAHVLPFAMLPWDGKPLIASRSVSTLPSASALRFLAGLRAGPLGGSVLAVGNPSNMSVRTSDGRVIPFRPLPGAAAEAATVAEMFGKDGTALIGPAATETAVRAEIGGRAIVHLATHGYLSEQAPLLSAVLLADGDDLAVYELVGLRIDASLVVLSACRTGLGEATGGDDVLGLSRGLLAAGAGAALVTLWPVGDVSTCLLMQDFYARLRAGQRPAAALRGAQNRLRTMDAAAANAARAGLSASLTASAAPHGETAEAARRVLDDDLRDHVRIQTTRQAQDYRHPRHWAPFVLVSPA